MLPLPRLDDETYQEILADAIRQIPGLTSEWTDFNDHDPGITLLQLLAWLKEMQQFYLDGIGDLHRLKYLKLLDHTPYGLTCAQTQLFFTANDGNRRLPQGTPFQSQQAVFELNQPFLLLKHRIRALLLPRKAEWMVLEGPEHQEGAAFLFDEQPEPGRFFDIGLDEPLPVGEAISLFIRLSDPFAQRRNSPQPGFFPLARLEWQAWDGLQWQPLPVAADETWGLLQSGRLTFSLEREMAPLLQQAWETPLYWLRCVLLESCYDHPPMILQLSLRTTTATQRHTRCQIQGFVSPGGSRQEYLLDTYLGCTGSLQVQVKGAGKDWEDWPAYHAPLPLPGEARQVVLLPHPEGKAFPLEGGSLQVLCREPAWQGIQFSSKGYPAQAFQLEPEEGILAEDFALQVGKQQNGAWTWQEWRQTEDLLSAGPRDRCYQLDPVKGRLLFGDGKNGAIPPAGEKNIRVVAYAQSLGRRGNVKAREFQIPAYFEAQLSGCRVTSDQYAEGGQDPETLEEAIQRFRRDFRRPHRAVTPQDYEELTLKTPGLLLQQVKALPHYRPDPLSPEGRQVPNSITLVVKSGFDQPGQRGMNPAYLKNIYRHLEPYRMVTTEIHVIPPRYIGIQVACTVELKPYFKGMQEQIRSFFQRELDGVKGEAQFGQALDYGLLYGKLEALDGIKRVLHLSLEPLGATLLKKQGGEILIPPEGLPYLALLDLEVKA